MSDSAFELPDSKLRVPKLGGQQKVLGGESEAELAPAPRRLLWDGPTSMPFPLSVSFCGRGVARELSTSSIET